MSKRLFRHAADLPSSRRGDRFFIPLPTAETDRDALLNPFFSFSFRKKRTGSICQEKKEGSSSYRSPKFSQKISAFIRPSRPSLAPERSRRSAHRLSETPVILILLLPIGADDSRVYLKTPDAPGQRAFSRCAAPFFLEIRQYSCEKTSCAAQKFLAAGHIESFQIHPTFIISKMKQAAIYL